MYEDTSGYGTNGAEESLQQIQQETINEINFENEERTKDHEQDSKGDNSRNEQD